MRMVRSFRGDGDEGDELGLAGGDELVAEGFEDWIVTGGDHGGHEQGVADAGFRPPPMKLLPRHWPD